MSDQAGSNESERARIGRRTFVAGGLAAGGAVAAPGLLPAAAATPAAKHHDAGRNRTPATAARRREKAVRSRQHTQVGIGYQTWFSDRVSNFETTEAVPILGKYRSADPKVIRQHARWLTWAGVDYLLVDWSNNLGGNWTNGTAESIIAGTEALLKEYQRMERHPQVTLLLGLDDGQAGTPHFLEQVELIKKRYLTQPAIRDLFVTHEGKPLLTVYTGARTTPPPDWDDHSFTLRWMGAFREIVLNPGGVWSWKDRVSFANGPQIPLSNFANDGLAGWTATGGWKVSDVETKPAFNISATVRCANTQPDAGGHQQTGTLTSPVFTVKERVISFNAIGIDLGAYEDLPSLENRNVYVLKDAHSGKVLRHAVPPGDNTIFAVRQWNVGDLEGRRVVFEAVNNRDNPVPYAWIGVDGLVQQRNEQVTAVPSSSGNQAPGGYANWDAKPRNHGATLTQMATGAFAFEPEFWQFTAWNEFGAPDQFSVPGSSDIEPTRVSQLRGAESDGWGYYYLDLMHDLVDQYRAGLEAPELLLDTRYP